MVSFVLKAMRSTVHMYAKGASHGDIVERENRLELTYELDIVCWLLYLHVGKRREGRRKAGRNWKKRQVIRKGKGGAGGGCGAVGAMGCAVRDIVVAP